MRLWSCRHRHPGRTWMLPALLFATVTLVAMQAPAGDTLVLTHANLIDGTATAPLANVTLTLKAGKIESISTQATAPPAGATVLDLKGKYVLPGLIDAHVHVASTAQVRTLLNSGVTTARSMGTSAYADIGLKELAKANRIAGPELLSAGYHVRPQPDEAFFIGEPALADMMTGGVTGPDRVRRMVSALLERGVDFIKVNATERAGTPETDPRKQLYSEEELRAAVETAGRRGVPVAAHAHGDEGAAAAVRAGVRSIEHGTYLSDATIALMKEKGTYLVPTIAIVTDLMGPGGDYQDPGLEVRGRHMYPRLRETVAKANRAGVRIVAATDAGYQPRSTIRLQHEIEELVKAGLTPMAAIQSATSLAATLLGIDKRTGIVKAGFEADLIAVERNPLENIVVLQDVLLVVNNGRIALNRLAW